MATEHRSERSSALHPCNLLFSVHPSSQSIPYSQLQSRENLETKRRTGQPQGSGNYPKLSRFNGCEQIQVQRAQETGPLMSDHPLRRATTRSDRSTFQCEGWAQIEAVQSTPVANAYPEVAIVSPTH
ncbi:hypothetical protein N7540_013108 [Penicillium herquei]|nr:hypothetical protein N7540_013248 [Penicillium herquei]KAJ6003826.1 hypothetical protein N7540_013108 [Penicillium herquei]